jgi:hypothetical protein
MSGEPTDARFSFVLNHPYSIEQSTINQWGKVLIFACRVFPYGCKVLPYGIHRRSKNHPRPTPLADTRISNDILFPAARASPADRPSVQNLSGHTERRNIGSSRYISELRELTTRGHSFVATTTTAFAVAMVPPWLSSASRRRT